MSNETQDEPPLNAVPDQQVWEEVETEHHNVFKWRIRGDLYGERTYVGPSHLTREEIIRELTIAAEEIHDKNAKINKAIAMEQEKLRQAGNPSLWKALVYLGPFLLELIFGGNEKKRSPIKRMPGHTLNRLLKAVLTKKHYERIIEPTFADCCDEYVAAEATGNKVLIAWVYIRSVGLLLWQLAPTTLLEMVLDKFRFKSE